MHQPPEQFEKLTALMKLKRYEVPPPGYFHRFSSQVIARIEVLSEQQPSWLKRFWTAFEARPSVAASCGVALGALLVTGFVLIKQPPDELLSWDPANLTLLNPTASRISLEPIAEQPIGLMMLQTVNTSLAPNSQFTPVSYWPR